MKESLKNLFDKLGLNKSNGLYLNEDNPKVNARIGFSLKYIDYDALYVLGDDPLIIFKEYENKDEYDRNFEDLHNNIWNLNDIPILFVILPKEIHVYNANIFDIEDSFLEKFPNFDDLSQFEISNLANRTFFDKYASSFKKSKKVQSYLLNNIKIAIELLSDDLPIDIIHNLIGKLIFSKYLIDRDIFKDYECDFNNLIRDKRELFNFFKLIENKFSSDLFKIDKPELISESHLTILSHLFNGDDLETNQTVLRCPYNFKIIPIELISNIYETFLGRETNNNKAFYTPLFLVDYILNRTLDKKLSNSTNCRILDPSCGSGVFLVESLRRIIDKNSEINSNLTPNDYKELLLNNIYGVDVDENAINISILSVHLTILDYLSDEEVKEFKMPPLKDRNFFIDDFFNLSGEFNHLEKMDLIVGNPPWGAEQELHQEYFKNNKIPVSNKEIAQTFLVRVKDFCHSDTEIALIVTSKILYNDNAKKFRNYFLNMFKLSQVLEFSAIRNKIFNNSSSPGTILFYNLKVKSEEKVTHISLKPNRLFYSLSSIVIQKNDIKYISQEDLINYDWIWKVLLYGNTLDFYLIKRLKIFSTLNDLINEGILTTSSGLSLSKKPRYDARKYLNYDFLDVSNKKRMLNRYYIDENNSEKWKIDCVDRIRTENAFKPPYVLIKKGINSNFQCVSTYSEKEWVFKDGVRSINGTDNKTLLKCIVAFLNSKLFTYISFLSFSSIGVERKQVFSNELRSIPIIEDETLEHYVDEILDEYKDNRDTKNIKLLEEKIDKHIFKLLSFDEIEMDLVNYLFDVTIPMIKNNKKIYQKISKKNLISYVTIFLNHFRHYFDERNNEFLHAICYLSEQFICVNFIIDSEKPKELIEFKESNDFLNFMGNISLEEKKNLFINKDIKGFNETSFYVIKSNEFKNWHEAIARIDIIEFMDLLLDEEIS